MANNPSISFPQWMLAEVDRRCRRGEEEDDVKRSHWIREACMARLLAEDAETWSTPNIDPESVKLHQEPVADGGEEG